MTVNMDFSTDPGIVVLGNNNAGNIYEWESATKTVRATWYRSPARGDAAAYFPLSNTVTHDETDKLTVEFKFVGVSLNKGSHNPLPTYGVTTVPPTPGTSQQTSPESSTGYTLHTKPTIGVYLYSYNQVGASPYIRSYIVDNAGNVKFGAYKTITANTDYLIRLEHEPGVGVTMFVDDVAVDTTPLAITGSLAGDYGYWSFPTIDHNSSSGTQSQNTRIDDLKVWAGEYVDPDTGHAGDPAPVVTVDAGVPTTINAGTASFRLTATAANTALNNIVTPETRRGVASMRLTARARRTPAPQTHKVLVVSTDGQTVYGDITREVANASFTEPGSNLQRFDFSLPAGSPAWQHIFGQRVREIQYWIGDRIIFWGPITDPKPLPGLGGTVRCKDARWYLERSQTGNISKFNHVANGSFEDGANGWTVQFAYYSNAQYPPEYEVVNTPVADGLRALRLSMDKTGHDCCASQTFQWTPDPTLDPEGTTWVLVAKYMIEEFNGAALENRGVMLELFDPAIPNDDPVLAALGHKKSVDSSIEKITEHTRVGEWIETSVELTIPPGATRAVAVRLYPPNGSIVYDEIGLYRREIKRFKNTDQVNIVEWAVQHAQDPLYGRSSFNLSVAGVGGPSRARTIEYDLDEAENIDVIVNSFSGVYDGLAYQMGYSPSTRYLTCWNPKAGIDRPEWLLVADERGGNVDAWDIDPRWEAAATAYGALGADVAGQRERGTAVKTGDYHDNRVLQTTSVVSDGTPSSWLTEVAAEGLASTLEPELVTVTLNDTLSKRWIDDGVRYGDRIRCRLVSAEYPIAFQTDEATINEWGINSNGRVWATLHKRAQILDLEIL